MPNSLRVRKKIKIIIIFVELIPLCVMESEDRTLGDVFAGAQNAFTALENAKNKTDDEYKNKVMSAIRCVFELLGAPPARPRPSPIRILRPFARKNAVSCFIFFIFALVLSRFCRCASKTPLFSTAPAPPSFPPGTSWFFP